MIAALSPAEFNYEETLSTLLPLGPKRAFALVALRVPMTAL